VKRGKIEREREVTSSWSSSLCVVRPWRASSLTTPQRQKKLTPPCVLFLWQHHGNTMRVLLWSVPFSRVWLLCFLVFFLRKELQSSSASFSASNPTRHSSCCCCELMKEKINKIIKNDLDQRRFYKTVLVTLTSKVVL